MTELAYNGTEGWSGSDTSRERAETRAADGSASETQQQILARAERAKVAGVTVADLRHSMDAHHGTISGSLTALHKGGLLFRLTETRDKCKVYVLPQYVSGRETESSVSNKQRAQIAALTEAFDALRKAERDADKTYRPGLRLARAFLQRAVNKLQAGA